MGELRAWRDMQPGDDLVFPGREGRWLPKCWIGDTFTAALPRAGIRVEGRNLVAHSLRHGYNTMIRRHVPEGVLRALTGHSSAAMSDRYDHPGIAERVAELEPARETVGRLLG
jgi:integrase